MASWIALFVGCAGLTGPASPPEPDVPAQCRNIHVDRLESDWTSVQGQAANPKVRMRITDTADGYHAWYIDGSFVRRELKGIKRDTDVQFTEVPTEARQKRVEAGEESLVRIYVEPSLKDCALKAFVGRLEGTTEKIPPRATEFVPMPEQQGVVFSYEAATEPLFLGEAASDSKVRDQQVEASGGPKPDVEMGTVPVGAWSAVEADGDPACTYDMDLYFDDLLVTEISPKPAAEPVDGMRHWFHEWSAPFSGNHHFELFRHRTCADGKRVRIAVAGVDAILM